MTHDFLDLPRQYVRLCHRRAPSIHCFRPFCSRYLLNSKIRGMPFFRGVYYLPVVASVVAISLVYMWIFYRTGTVNFILGQLRHF